ncbi:MAG: hypothetical protein V7K39_18440 [Nostoc sp.]
MWFSLSLLNYCLLTLHEEEYYLTGEQQEILNSWLRKSTTPVGLAKRARANVGIRGKIQ